MLKKYSVVLVIVLILCYLFFIRIHTFLSPVKPLQDAQVLVVDAWLNDMELSEAVAIYNSGHYTHVLVPGGILERSLFFPGISNAGELTAITLMYKGIPPEKIHALNVKHVKRDRTYQSALTVKQWLIQNKTEGSVNLFTSSTHSRRSWMLYKKAFGDRNTGIIASQTIDYDHERWWKSSKGFRTVTSEFIAFLYAFLFFHPDL
jgi:uncharacterized SAM-binding protein YcdF (DUF218 family)